MDLATKEPEVVLSSEEQQSHDDSDVEDLTEEEIKTILREAAQRIRTKAKAENNSALGKYNALKLPTPGANAVSKGYIRTAGDIARVDSGRLLDNSSRELSNKIRKVEDPILVRQNKEKVSRKISKSTLNSSDENIPKLSFLSGFGTPYWASSCNTESICFIVTLTSTSILSLKVLVYFKKL